jgi:hypothetical protein
VLAIGVSLRQRPLHAYPEIPSLGIHGIRVIKKKIVHHHRRHFDLGVNPEFFADADERRILPGAGVNDSSFGAPMRLPSNSP